MEKFLSITGFGDVFEAHFESGIVLARGYFYEYGLDFLACYAAFEKDEKSELGQHWIATEQKVNMALYGFNLQNSSMLELGIVGEEFY